MTTGQAYVHNATAPLFSAMGSVSQTELENRYERLTTELGEIRSKRREFVQEKSQELSEAHSGLSGSFSVDSLREIDGQHPFIPSDDSTKQEAMNEVLEEVANTDEYQRLTNEISKLEKQLDEVWELAADIIVDEESNKKENIGRIWAAFGEDISNRRVAEAVGCHAQYPGRLTFDPDSNTVDYKEHVQRRKDNQVRSELRQEILKRDGKACVRCGAQSDEHDLKIHHIDPVDNEGPAIRENLATLCEDCHSTAHDARGAGAVFYKSTTGFWQWVRDGSRGFDPNQTQSSLDEF